jgi:prepilin-type N-terminal cleavage/methylation domain-containing protein
MPVNRRAFSMVEVIVASVIFAAAVAMIFATMARTQLPVMSSDERVKAAFFGKRILDGLSRSVTANALAADDLDPGEHGPFYDNAAFPGYSATYVVTNGVDGVRKVVVNVTWDSSL